MEVLAGEGPPPLATRLELDDIYDQLAELGLECGPVFQGLRAAWREGDRIFVEVTLPEEHRDAAGSFGIHPALLDAALRGAGEAAGDDTVAAVPERVSLPLSWEDVTLHATGAASLRACVSRVASGVFALALADESGAPVASIGSVSLKELSPEALSDARRRHTDSLFRVEWEAVAAQDHSEQPRWATVGEGARELASALCGSAIPPGLAEVADAESGNGRHDAPAHDARAHADLEELRRSLDAGVEPPEVVFVGYELERLAQAATVAASGTAEAGVMEGVLDVAHATARSALALLQSWMADERLAESRLVVLTRNAVAARAGDDVRGLAVAPVWGLLRSAQSEHPGGLTLLDLDDEPGSWEVVWPALAGGEPQLAIRKGEIHMARLVPVPIADDASLGQQHDLSFGVDGTVLITGGARGLGALVARRLAGEHGARSLVLAGSEGENGEGAAELKDELEGLGARVTLAKCELTDREQLRQLIAGCSAEHQLSAVVHSSGVLDDGVLGLMTAERLERVLRSKLDTAVHLHELTVHLGLPAFVLISDVGGTLGIAGQGSRAAAGAFLDALAAYRQACGMSGVSIAWGPRAEPDENTREPQRRNVTRMARAGVDALGLDEAPELFDAASCSGEASVLAVRFDRSALRALARADELAPMMRGIVRVSVRRSSGGGSSLARRLAGVPESERAHVVLEVVRAEVALVLGHSSATAIDVKRPFQDLGFDSVTAVELRNRLSRASGLHLSGAVVFDYPTPVALGGYLLSELTGAQTSPYASAIGQLGKLELTLRSLEDDAERAKVRARLRQLLEGLGDLEGQDSASVIEKIRFASDEEIFNFIDGQLN
jgi:NAD(P)-dependent dehydrogenase (short-subunit alcohol dehydrogenase family)